MHVEEIWNDGIFWCQVIYEEIVSNRSEKRLVLAIAVKITGVKFEAKQFSDTSK